MGFIEYIDKGAATEALMRSDIRGLYGKLRYVSFLLDANPQKHSGPPG
jgi:hypothetical protein